MDIGYWLGLKLKERFVGCFQTMILDVPAYLLVVFSWGKDKYWEEEGEGRNMANILELSR